ncbi:DUF1641 domain-containing protein [Thermocladium modestius]|uniref:DUF1641 domain-containing protein n=1 Tax=Thermocladium modestius TaxID=62609 RepID=UPI001667D185|nr:DUF1641 domain-containing protein [Thermocladium modestius]
MASIDIDEEMERLLSPRTVGLLGKMVDLLRKLDEAGILDAISSLAASDVVGELAKVLLTTDLVRLLNGIDNLLRLAGELSDGEAVDSIEKLLGLAKALNRLGVLDSLEDLAGNPELLVDASKALLGTGFIHLLNNLDELNKALTAIDFKALASLMDALMRGLKAGAGPQDSLGLIKAVLSNDDAKRGLAVAINVLSKLGATIAPPQ